MSNNKSMVYQGNSLKMRNSQSQNNNSKQDRAQIGSFISRGDQVYSRDSGNGSLNRQRNSVQSHNAGRRYEDQKQQYSRQNNNGNKPLENNYIRQSGNRRVSSAIRSLKLKENCQISEWLTYNAPILLESSLKTLGLDPSTIDSSNLDTLSVRQLQEEK